MNTKWMLGVGVLVISNVSLAAGWQESQTITEYFVDGADSGERLYVGFEYAPNPDTCGSRRLCARERRYRKRQIPLLNHLERTCQPTIRQSQARRLRCTRPPDSYRFAGGVRTLRLRKATAKQGVLAARSGLIDKRQAPHSDGVIGNAYHRALYDGLIDMRPGDFESLARCAPVKPSRRIRITEGAVARLRASSAWKSASKVTHTRLSCRA